MARPCTICGHASRAAIDAALLAGTPPAKVAARYPDASARCVLRHAASRHHQLPQETASQAAPAPRSPPAPPALVVGSAGLAEPETVSAGVPEVPAQSAPAPRPANDAESPPSDRLPEEQIPPTREAKVGSIMGMMAAGLWEDGVSLRDLARAWGMAEGSIAHIAGEARRRMKSAIDPRQIGQIVAATCHRGLAAAVAMVEAGDAKALNGLASIARVYKDLLPAPAEEKGDEPAVFRIELSTPERPAPEVPCPSGSSSPPAADPAAG